jgi:hypothetical protein|tara:strand:- start:21866 stop:22267 length:402 start_codon:yes stop_codon:yes gene_type:complete
MKAILFINLLAISVLVSSCGGSDVVEVGNKTSMEVEPVFDAGKVLKGEKIDAEFKIKNTGSYPLVVAEVKGSCTCTVADKPEDPIMPGDSYVIRAYVDTERTGTGAISKSITIVANTDPSVSNVVVKAIVMNK